MACLTDSGDVPGHIKEARARAGRTAHELLPSEVDVGHDERHWHPQGLLRPIRVGGADVGASQRVLPRLMHHWSPTPRGELGTCA